MTAETSRFAALRGLSRDGRLLFATRFLRLFAYGLLSVILVLYLKARGLGSREVGLLLFLTFIGDMSVSLLLTATADRFGRRRTLRIGALLMIFAAALLGLSSSVCLLALGVTIGVLSPGGGEVGPFLSVEQAGLAQTTPNERRTAVFGYYAFAGATATALGALLGGAVVQSLSTAATPDAAAYFPLVVAYAGIGVVLFALFTALSPAVEAFSGAGERPMIGVRHSRPVVIRLAVLFFLDSFASGLVLQSLLAYWFHLRFGTEPGALGRLFCFAGLFAGLSGLLAVRLARWIGLINTVVFTHMPASVLLILIPLMPSERWAMALLLLRYCVAQMDVPARQSYTMAVVHPDERAAAAGLTAAARTIASALAAPLATVWIGSGEFDGLPLFVAGGLKIAYDLLLYRNFKSLRPPEEQIR